METVKIIVGDKTYETNRSTLEKAAYFKGKMNDVIYLNIDGFDNILDHLRDPESCPIDYNYANEADIILNNAKIITVNVGGTKFNVSSGILNKMSYFKNINNSEIFIDKNPEIFKIILRYITDPDYKIPEFIMNKKQFHNDLAFYGTKLDNKQNISIVNKISPTDIKKKKELSDELAYYTGTPEITYFKSVYRRHTHFDFFYKYHDPKIDIGKLNSRENITINLPYNHFPMIAMMYFVLDIDVDVDLSKLSNNSEVRWIDHVEPFVFENVTVNIGDVNFEVSTSQSMYVSEMISIYEDEYNENFTYASYYSKHKINYNLKQQSTKFNKIVQRYTPPNLKKIIIPYTNFFWGTNDGRVPFPLIAISEQKFNIILKLSNLTNLLRVFENDEDMTHKYDMSKVIRSANVNNFTLVTKNIVMSKEEKNRFIELPHEYITQTMETYSAKLDKNIDLVDNYYYCKIPIEGEYYLDSLFIYFVEGDNLLPYGEPMLYNIELLKDGKTYFNIDKDMVLKIMEVERMRAYRLSNIYNYNIGYNKVNIGLKGANICVHKSKLELVIKLKPDFKSTRVYVIGKGEYLMRIKEKNIIKLAPTESGNSTWATKYYY
jgi:hypothetical protein